MAAKELSLSELRDSVGKEIAVGDWFEITQERIDRFADVTEDRQWIHTDPQRAARESPFQTTVAHGYLTLSMTSALVAQALRVKDPPKLMVNYGFNRIRFPAPVPAGSRIRVRLGLHSFEDVKNVPGALQLQWKLYVDIEGVEKPALAAEWIVRYYGEAAG